MDLEMVRKQTRAYVADMLLISAYVFGYVLTVAGGVFGAYWLILLNGSLAAAGLGGAGALAQASRTVQKHVRQRKAARVAAWATHTPPVIEADLAGEIRSLLGDWVRLGSLLSSALLCLVAMGTGIYFLACQNAAMGGGCLVGAGLMFKLTWWLSSQLGKRRAARAVRL
ncbi:hypothetical protein ACIOUE_37735 [Streptomyces xanthochromogenes]|uniref:hypothetical protein n=1 Tax=Streptomyces xanthochromogenes TaxID=67384 RepID=UPI00380639BC